MGSGKSTVTPRLARCLGFESLDLDEEISSWLGMSIPAIFDVLGEDRFREEEKRQLLKTINKRQLVVSLGGGTIADADNVATCKQNGVLVYLRGSAEFLAHRLESSRQNRPLLHGPNGEALTGAGLLERVRSLLESRSSSYESAHVTVDIDDKNPTAVARAVVEALDRLGRIDG